MSGIDPSLFELFREEVRSQTAALASGLIELEANPRSAGIEPLMRCAHSLKGSARIIGIDPAVHLAHAMEDLLVAAQNGIVRPDATSIDLLLKGCDLLATLSEIESDSIAAWNARYELAIEPLIRQLKSANVTDSSETPSPFIRAISNDQIDTNTPVTAAPDVTEIALPTHRIASAGYGMIDLFLEQLHETLTLLLPACEGVDILAIDDVLESLRALRSSARIMKLARVEETTLALLEFLAKSGANRRSLSWFKYAVSLLASLLEHGEETFASQILEIDAGLRDACTALAIHHMQVKPIEGIETSLDEIVAEAELQAVAAPNSISVADAAVRISARSLSRLMGLAGESLVQSRWLQPFAGALQAARKQHDQITILLDGITNALQAGMTATNLIPALAEARRGVVRCRQELVEHAADFDAHAARTEDLNTQLYREVIASRMRPFTDGTGGLTRLVRDMARTLGKQAHLAIEGEQTEVDRDVLEKLEAPLGHLIRNAVDHGIEDPVERLRAGKPERGTIRLRAYHQAGMLFVAVSDDGKGIELKELAKRILDKGLSTVDLLRRMGEAELLEFLFLPGFTTAGSVTEFSGRGVGLDVVQDSIRRIGGTVRITTKPGHGTTFQLQLPVTLSVIRAVVVSIGDEPYAFPHTRIDRLLRVERSDIRSIELRQFITVDGRTIGLVMAGQLLELHAVEPAGSTLPIVLLSDASGSYGLIVDAVLGEQDLVVRPLDPRLGKIPDISAAAILNDGTPVLVVDVEDAIRSMDHYIQTGTLRLAKTQASAPTRKKRILVVDDSITVREVERQLLLHKGYDVAVAVDGVDGWNQARLGKFDLIVTDVDMPRMTGLQLVQTVRADEGMRNLPIVIVSYKERDEDRIRGLEVGANAYLTKSSFHDNRFVEMVEDLIGPG